MNESHVHLHVYYATSENALNEVQLQSFTISARCVAYFHYFFFLDFSE